MKCLVISYRTRKFRRYSEILRLRGLLTVAAGVVLELVCVFGFCPVAASPEEEHREMNTAEELAKNERGGVDF